MNHCAYRRLLAIGLALALAVLPACAFAHSGRTDSRGGHKDNKNKSGLGSYHFHCGGFPAHLHPGGVCPYSSNGTSSRAKSSSSSSSASASSVQDVEAIVQDGVTLGIISPSLDLDTQTYSVPLFSGHAVKALNVRQKPDSGSRKLGQLAKDDEVLITEAFYTPSWHQVIFGDKVGYIYADYCDLSDEVVKDVAVDVLP